MVDGDIGEATTAARVAETAISTFGSIEVSTNLDGFIYMTQLAIKQMLAQKSGGSIVSITASLADNPIAGDKCLDPMITKGGINAITRSLAIEHANFPQWEAFRPFRRLWMP